MAYIITLTFNKKIVIILSILFLALHIPAHYGTESMDMLYSTELSGANFFASKASLDGRDGIAYNPSPIIKFYNNRIQIHSGELYDYEMLLKPSISNYSFSSFHNLKYMLITKQFNNLIIYNYDVNLYDFQLGYNSAIYSNGNFDIYLSGFQES